MSATQEEAPTVVVIDKRPDQASTLKTMIEFLDTPEVTVADTSSWANVVSSRKIKAVFLGPGLSQAETSNIRATLHQQCREVPVVVVGEDDVSST